MNRRDLIKLGLYGGTGGLLHLTGLDTGKLAWALNEKKEKHENDGDADDKKKKPKRRPTAHPPAFTNSLPLPPVKRPVDPATLPGVPTFNDGVPTTYYEVHMKQGTSQIFPVGQKPTIIWGYDGMYLGPTFEAAIGERVVVRQHNDLPVNTIVHHHGAHTPSVSDGSALFSQQIPPGTFKDFIYPNDDDVSATHWYHDHDIDFTGHNVFMGLEGFFLLHDQTELNLNLPGNPNDPPAPGELPFDLPLVFQDRAFDLNNQLAYNPFNHDGFIGDTFLVNGAIQPSIRVANRKYRLRLLNGSNARFYRFSLSSGLPFSVIGSDGGLLPKRADVSSIEMGPAERVEVIVDFTGLALGTQVVMSNCLVQTNGRGPDGVTTNCTPLCSFNIQFEAFDGSSNPQILRTDIPVYDPAQSVITREWRFERGQGAWQINGKFFDPTRIDATVKVGTTEIWSLINGGGGWYHPVHIHRNQFHILDRNGKPPGPTEQGLKDVFVLNPGETVRVITKYTGTAQVGPYVMHCHNVEHEDMRMMIIFNVVP